MKKPNFQKTKSARVIQVIETVSLAGDGTDIHPVYELHQYWSMDGKLLAKSDSPEPEIEQNLSGLSTGHILKELVKRDDVRIKEHHLTDDCISLSLQIGSFKCSEIPEFLDVEDTSHGRIR